MTTTIEQTIIAKAIVEQVHQLFAGRDAEIVGAVLADLLATFLAGHMIVGDKDATEKMRREILKFHTATVRALIPYNEREILQREAEEEARHATFQ